MRYFLLNSSGKYPLVMVLECFQVLKLSLVTFSHHSPMLARFKRFFKPGCMKCVLRLAPLSEKQSMCFVGEAKEISFDVPVSV